MFRLLPFVIHLPISITVNKIPTVQVSCCGNLLILLTQLAKCYYRPYPDITISLAALPPKR